MHWLDQIRADNRSGAVALSIRAAEALMAEAPQSAAALAETARALVQAQPAMAPLFHLANRLLFGGPEHVSEVCRNFIRQVETSADAIAMAAARLIPRGASVLTHSFSSTVLEALRKARPAGVICTESRPMLEGVALARELARAGIPVRLIVDAAAARFVSEAGIVLVGADSVSPSGLMNKIGTALIALAAQQSRVPVYALCGSEKFVPRALPQQPREPREILSEAIPGVTPVNYYFDVTPLDLFAGIVTEEGVLPPGEARARASAIQVHPALCKEDVSS